MTELARSPGFLARRQAWLSQLRTVCVVVSEQPAHLVRSISVTQGFVGVSADDHQELLVLAVRLVGEYALEAETMDRGSSITAWISRPSAGQPEGEHPALSDRDSGEAKLGFFGRIRRALKHREHESTSTRPAPLQGPDGTQPVAAPEGIVVS